MSATARIHAGGAALVAGLFNKTVSQGTNIYLGLRTLDGAGGHPSDAAAADSLTSNLQEVSGGGYSRASITINSTNLAITTSGSNSVITFTATVFNFSGSISGITHAFIATTSDNSGSLIASAPLQVTRNVANGDSITVTFVLTINAG